MSETKLLNTWSPLQACKFLSQFCTLACLAYAPTLVALQEQPGAAQPQTNAVVEEVVYTDNLGRDTPRSSFEGFLKATQEFDYKTAVEYMDLRNLPSSVRKYSGEELAEELDFVIKLGMKINTELLSTKNIGQVVDGLPDYRDELGRVDSSEGELVLFLQRVPGSDDNFIWKISNASIAHVPELYEWYKYPGWVESIRGRVPNDVSFLGIELFKWLIVLGIAALSYPLFWLIGLGLSKVICKPGSDFYQPVRKLLTRPVTIIAVGLLASSLLQELGLGPTARKIVEANTLITIVAVWILFSLIDLAREWRRQIFIQQGRADAHILGRPLANALKLLTLLMATLVWLSNAGVEITALLAGLGVGGIALALALQKPIEDLLGAISIYSQQPVLTGDFCKYGNITGNIEEIGLRTTRIRTLEDTLVSVPNCLIAHGPIENYSARKKILYHPELPLRYDTTQEQMQTIIAGIESVAREHEKVIDDLIRVLFTEFSENAMVIRARFYVDETDFSNYLAIVADLNMGIVKVVQDAGAHFAQGAKTVMLEYGNSAGTQAVLPFGRER